MKKTVGLLPGETVSLLPGETVSLLPGETASLLPGETVSLLPGERGVGYRRRRIGRRHCCWLRLLPDIINQGVLNYKMFKQTKIA